MDWSAILDNAPDLAAGLLVTLRLSLISACTALTLGALLAWALQRGQPWLHAIVRAYIDFVLGLPMLVLIYLLFFILPEYGITLSSPVVGVTALTLYYGPYMGEVLRSAFGGIARGQYEASAALGLRPWETLRHVLLKQALPVALPPSVGLLIGLIKDTALLSVVGVEEFMYAAKQAISTSYAPLEIYLVVALAYWLITLLLDTAAGAFERRLNRHRLART
ncbi:amino acid ABC transporter permease [Pseudomonas sp. Irchel 3A5]|uniref:amino acid ABC transporter permease n=1 Tax=Pseudomonas sp. Irchel 3A5 TaxID=2008911 RepID=UPI000BA2CBBB|nr:amino acid ABC transporter permease [Pseudomonas sp. Irchel 3A5]